MELETKENGVQNQQCQSSRENQKQLKRQISCTHVKNAKSLNTRKKDKEQEKCYKNKMKIQIIKLNNITLVRFPSEALKEIASQEQEGKI